MSKIKISGPSDRASTVKTALRADLGAKLREALSGQVLPSRSPPMSTTICGGLCEPMCRQCHRLADEAADDHTLYCPRGCCDG